jgi:hypothetical protein
MERYYYANSFKGFKSDSSDAIIGTLTNSSEFDIDLSQRFAWNGEISLMKQVLVPYEKGEIVFEYSIPRLGKRIDIVAIIKGVIFVLEFKVGNKDFNRPDVEQVWDYALDLKNFHEDSHHRTIVPILIATNADSHSIHFTPSIYDDKVFEPIESNADSLPSIIEQILALCDNQEDDAANWIYSRYSPTPTIIQAASYMYNHHTVKDITRTEASAENLTTTSNYVIDIIEQTKQRGEKAICFVTGVPGAGKTLVGLNVAIEQFEKHDLAVYLSGNDPLVKVLTEALARDKKKQKEEETKTKYNITDARREVRSFIQIIHHYRNNTLAKIKIEDGMIAIDPSKTIRHKSDGYAEVDHVAIFDEAQRAWTKEQLAGWLSRKQGIPNFCYSEPAFLIWSLNLREDWAVIVCLVGGGQEINTGEAGISEWIKALNEHFPQWKVYISEHLTDKEYAEGKVNDLLADNPHVILSDKLHLAVSMRSFRAEKLSAFVHHLLDLNVDTARSLYNDIHEHYPIILTRSLDTAKQWLKTQARGTERYGMLVSSQAYRLKPLAIDVRVQPDTVHWFLDDDDDVRSSLFLEDAASEFDIQGLELDWSCVVWDGDFRYTPRGWANYSFLGSRWTNINKEERKLYQKNAYRVLLTRARQGMIVVVPEGNKEDATRKPEFYDSTFNYLKSLGLKVI